jgi:hypothetical protein
MKSVSHSKIQYSVIEEYSDSTFRQVIKLKDKIYQIDYLPRPCKNESDLRCVFVNNIRYTTFAKFLKLNS